MWYLYQIQYHSYMNFELNKSHFWLESQAFWTQSSFGLLNCSPKSPEPGRECGTCIDCRAKQKVTIKKLHLLEFSFFILPKSLFAFCFLLKLSGLWRRPSTLTNPVKLQVLMVSADLDLNSMGQWPWTCPFLLALSSSCSYTNVSKRKNRKNIAWRQNSNQLFQWRHVWQVMLLFQFLAKWMYFFGDLDNNFVNNSPLIPLHKN